MESVDNVSVFECPCVNKKKGSYKYKNFIVDTAWFCYLCNNKYTIGWEKYILYHMNKDLLRVVPIRINRYIYPGDKI